MVYLEYNPEGGEVVEIHETEVTPQPGYVLASSDSFVVGDEFEQSIIVNEVIEGIITSHSSVRNNPNAKRLLQENAALIEKTVRQEEQIAELNLQDIFQMELLIERGLV